MTRLMIRDGSKSAFEKREPRCFDPNTLAKRRSKVLPPGAGLYLDDVVNMRWMTWRACWEWLCS